MLKNGVLILMCIGISWSTCSAQQIPENNTISSSHGFTLYDENPDHLWNRMHRTLIGRTDQNGKIYGLDDIHLLYWNQTTHLTEGDSLDAALEVLTEFVADHGETQINTPIKRAVLQRDLWSLFDWFTNKIKSEEFNPKHRDMQQLLVTAIKRIALTSEEVASLSNTYQQAVEAKLYPVTLDLSKDDTSFLPPKLLAEGKSPWVRIYGEPLTGDASMHISRTFGHSMFWVYLKLPGGHQQTWEYINTLRHFPAPFTDKGDPEDIDFRLFGFGAGAFSRTNVTENPDLPQFPAGTQTAIVEQAMLITDTGTIVSSPLILHVRINTFKSIGKFRVSENERAIKFTEHRLQRSALFRGEAGGLVKPDERELIYDPFVQFKMEPFITGTPQKKTFHMSCHSCHSSTGLYSFQSRFRLIGMPGHRTSQQGMWRGKPNDMDNPHPQVQEAGSKISWKKKQYNWGLLEGLWRAGE